MEDFLSGSVLVGETQLRHWRTKAAVIAHGRQHRWHQVRKDVCQSVLFDLGVGFIKTMPRGHMRNLEFVFRLQCAA